MADHVHNRSLRDILRMVFRRRWLFLLGASLFATLALLGAHHLPVQYTGSTKFERRSDPASEQGLEKGSQSFETIKLTLNQELAGQKAIERVIDELGMTRGLPRDSDGQLTSQGLRARQELAESIRQAVTIRWEVRSQSVDLVSVTVTHPNADLAQKIPDTLVKNYINLVGERMRQRLTASRDFLQAQVRDAEQRVKEYTDRRISFETRHAGMMPESPGALQAQIQRITSDIDTLRRQQSMAEQTLARLGSMQQTATAPTSQPVQVIRGPNPELARLQQQLRQTRDSLAVSASVGHMTESHPTVMTLKSRIEQLEQQIAETPEESVLQTIYGSGAASDSIAADMAAAQADYDTSTRELERIEARLDALQVLMANFAPIRQEYLSIVDSLNKETKEADLWRSRLTNVQMSLAAEMASRRTHLDAVEAAQKQYRPSSPGLMVVLAFAFVGGLGFGGALVFLSNVLDRTLATPEDAREQFNVPVFGVIGEITTRHQRRMRRLRRWLLGPAIASVVLVALGLSSLSMMLWLRHPEKYARWRTAPVSFVTETLAEAGQARTGP